MELRVHHRTTYRYQSPVDMAQQMKQRYEQPLREIFEP